AGRSCRPPRVRVAGAVEPHSETGRGFLPLTYGPGPSGASPGGKRLPWNGRTGRPVHLSLYLFPGFSQSAAHTRPIYLPVSIVPDLPKTTFSCQRPPGCRNETLLGAPGVSGGVGNELS